MKTNIINIGNSQGLIIPAILLRKLNLSFKSSVELEVEDGKITIKPTSRQGWAEAALEMHKSGDDLPLIDETLTTDFDKEEWTW